MNWYQVVLLLVTIVCIGAPMLYVLGIKEKEMHPNVEEVHDIQALRLENAKLRELVLKNWYIALSERDALRANDIDPDGGTYMTALDDEIATAKGRMRELGIEAGDA